MRQADRWRRALTVATVVSAIAVAGCTDGDPGDGPTATLATSMSPTPSPSPTVDLTRLPEKPAAMSEPTTDGAIAAATYMLDLYTYAFVTGDTAPWRALAASTCEFCSGVVEGVDELAAAGHASTGGPFRVQDSRAVEVTESEWFSVDLVAVQEPSRRVDAEGATVADNPGGSFRVVYALSWNDGWRVDEMGFERVDATESPDA